MLLGEDGERELGQMPQLELLLLLEAGSELTGIEGSQADQTLRADS